LFEASEAENHRHRRDAKPRKSLAAGLTIIALLLLAALISPAGFSGFSGILISSQRALQREHIERQFFQLWIAFATVLECKIFLSGMYGLGFRVRKEITQTATFFFCSGWFLCVLAFGCFVRWSRTFG
jgi:hypothetical protein